jgi:uncharacterized protein (TIGR02145 family)
VNGDKPLKVSVPIILVAIMMLFLACSSDGDSVSVDDSTETSSSSSHVRQFESSSSRNHNLTSSSSNENGMNDDFEKKLKTSSSSKLTETSSSYIPKTQDEYYALYDDDSLNIVVCGNLAFEIKGSNCYRYAKCVVEKTGEGYKYCSSWTGNGCPADAFYSSACVNATCTKWETAYSYDSSFVMSNPFCEYAVVPNYTEGMSCQESQDFIRNPVSNIIYVCDADTLRLPKDSELSFEKKCTSFNRSDLIEKNELLYECKKSGWTMLLAKDYIVDERDEKKYAIVKINNQVWMYDNLAYERDSSWCVSEEDCALKGRLYTWSTAMNVSNECDKSLCDSFLEQGLCPEGWFVPDSVQLKNMYEYAKENNVLDQINVLSDLEEYIPLWSRNYNSPSYTNAYQLILQPNDPTKGHVTAVPKSKGGYVKCVQGAFEAEQYPYDYKKIVDERDGNEYRIITIGNQTWMAENLNYDVGEFQSWCFQFTESYCEKYGRLYTWDAVMGNLPTNENGYVAADYIEQPHQGICPNEWHVPTDSEWIELRNFVGDSGEKLKSSFGWKNNGTDLYHFRALPAGYSGNINNPSSKEKSFHEISNSTFFHTTRQTSVNATYVGMLSNKNASVTLTSVHKYIGASLRCVKNEDPKK